MSVLIGLEQLQLVLRQLLIRAEEQCALQHVYDTALQLVLAPLGRRKMKRRSEKEGEIRLDDPDRQYWYY